MEPNELLRGVGVVIDDEIFDASANIQKIVRDLEAKHIPLIKYSEIPSDEAVRNFGNISFLLLDWQLLNAKLDQADLVEGVRIPEQLAVHNVGLNIELIRQLKEICFCPIFIFTNNDVQEVINTLITSNLYVANKPNSILVESKKDLQRKNKVFTVVGTWIKENPSIYVLKEWEREYVSSKNKLFTEFYEFSPIWPKIMWENYATDKVNQSHELGHLISRNLYTRMTPFNFSPEILNKQNPTWIYDKKDLMRVLEGERFIKNLGDTDICPGDLFLNGGKYYLNIRARCDLIPNRNKLDSSYDDVELYLIQGQKLGARPLQESFDSAFGCFRETDNQSIQFPINGGNAISFGFKNLTIQKWGELKEKRIGRILPPYINKLQQKYGSYSQRQGLPRLPGDILE